jgi:hypothetical protein
MTQQTDSTLSSSLGTLALGVSAAYFCGSWGRTLTLAERASLVAVATLGVIRLAHDFRRPTSPPDPATSPAAAAEVVAPSDDDCEGATTPVSSASSSPSSAVTSDGEEAPAEVVEPLYVFIPPEEKHASKWLTEFELSRPEVLEMVQEVLPNAELLEEMGEHTRGCGLILLFGCSGAVTRPDLTDGLANTRDTSLEIVSDALQRLSTIEGNILGQFDNNIFQIYMPYGKLRPEWEAKLKLACRQLQGMHSGMGVGTDDHQHWAGVAMNRGELAERLGQVAQLWVAHAPDDDMAAAAAAVSGPVLFPEPAFKPSLQLHLTPTAMEGLREVHNLTVDAVQDMLAKAVPNCNVTVTDEADIVTWQWLVVIHGMGVAESTHGTGRVDMENWSSGLPRGLVDKFGGYQKAKETQGIYWIWLQGWPIREGWRESHQRMHGLDPVDRLKRCEGLLEYKSSFALDAEMLGENLGRVAAHFDEQQKQALELVRRLPRK